nr:isopentenyl diphosphate delta isomerase [Hymenolepis microstoma]
MTLGESNTPTRRGGASLIGSSAAADEAAAQDSKDIELLSELYRRMDRIQPTIPDRVSTVLLESAGVRLNPGEGDARLARLISLAGEKFITDILTDTMMHWNLSNGQNTGLLANPTAVQSTLVPKDTSGNPLAGQGTKQAGSANSGRPAPNLTMENLLAALRDRNIPVARPPYYK